MRFIVATALKDLRRRLADPAALVFWLGIPLVVGSMIALIQGDGGAPKAHLMVADLDETFVSGLVAGAGGQEGAAQFMEIEQVELDEGRERIDAGDGSALLILPEGFGDAVLKESLAKLTADPDFATWSADLPRSSDDSQQPFTLTARSGLADGKIDLWLQWRDAPRLVEWFPDPSDSLKVDDVEVRTRGSLTRIDAVVRKLAGTTEKSNSLSSLVVMVDENGRRRGWELAVDLKNAEH